MASWPCDNKWWGYGEYNANLFFQEIGKNEDDLKPTNTIMTDFTRSNIHEKETTMLIVGLNTLCIVFFVVDANSNYNLLLRCDWIHTNECVPSARHGKRF